MTDAQGFVKECLHRLNSVLHLADWFSVESQTQTNNFKFPPTSHLLKPQTLTAYAHTCVCTHSFLTRLKQLHQHVASFDHDTK